MKNPSLYIQEAKLWFLEIWRMSYAQTGLFTLVVVIIYILVKVNLKRRQSEYILHTLQKNGLANDHSVIVKNGIKCPNKSAADFREHVALI
jgi:hypothetical protein